MRTLLGRTVNAILKPAGLRVSTVGKFPFLDDLANPPNYLRLVADMQGILSELIFKDLPHCDRRTRLLAELIGTSVSEAMCLVDCLHRSLPHEGDVCEFGVAQGATSALIANEMCTSGKNLWLFDSFQGLPKPSEKDQLIDDIFNLGQMERYEGTMACPIHMVEARLRAISFPFSSVKIVPGFIEETIHSPSLPAKVCFAYVDFDFYNPIVVALKFLHDRLPVGGFIVVDDYGWFSSGAKAAVDEFASEYQDTFELIHPPRFAGHFCMLRKKLERAGSGRHGVMLDDSGQKERAL